MLKILKIKNIALIKDLELSLENGLNVLTGETGAGKSIIIDSIGFLLGSKADKGLIRYGETSAKVEGLFFVDKNDLIDDFFEKYDIEYDDNILITRSLNIDGKNECRINGSIVTVGILKELTCMLVNIHGQNEHQQILNEKYQLQILDDYIGEKIKTIKNSFNKKYQELVEINKSISLIGTDDETRNREIDYLNYLISEIKEANIQEDEEQELRAEKKLMQNSEKIVSSLRTANELISGDYGHNISTSLKSIKSSLSVISGFSEEINNCYERVESVRIELDDINNTIEELINTEYFDEDKLNKIDARIDKINSIKSKYGENVAQINEYLEKSIVRLDLLTNSAERLEELKKEKSNILQDLYTLSKSIREIRTEYAKKLSDNIAENLKELNMKANIYFQFNEFPNFDTYKNIVSSNGVDNVVLMLSANVGHLAQPLSKIISGGEMSRFMLAFKCVLLSSVKYSQTVIFDEIDVGISGVTAQAVANKMALISKHEQVIVISHLFQIGAMADYHYLISKYVIDNNTYTNVKLLDKQQSISELIKMVSGDTESSNSQLHIQDILSKNEKFKKSL